MDAFQKMIKEALQDEVKRMADEDFMYLMSKIKSRYEEAIASVVIKIFHKVSFEINSKELIIKVDTSELEDKK